MTFRELEAKFKELNVWCVVFIMLYSGVSLVCVAWFILHLPCPLHSGYKVHHTAIDPGCSHIDNTVLEAVVQV